MILYAFILHEKIAKEQGSRIKKMMSSIECSHFILVQGGAKSTTFDAPNHLLFLECSDSYEGLPEKVFKTIAFITGNKEFEKYTHVFKCDKDTVIKSNLPYNNLKFTDYGGKITYKSIDRYWHIGKCSEDTWINSNPYKGDVVPYCRGGYGYLLSKKACMAILKTGTKFIDHTEIYEDLFIGKLLHQCAIYPKDISHLMYNRVYSPDHKLSHPFIERLKSMKERYF
jgi:hypothetical protein